MPSQNSTRSKTTRNEAPPSPPAGVPRQRKPKTPWMNGFTLKGGLKLRQLLASEYPQALHPRQ